MPPKFLLQPRYKDAEYSVSVKTLFCEILKIPNASVDDLIEELTRIQQLGCSDFDQVCDIYKHIHGMASSMNDSESARVRYVKHSNVFYTFFPHGILRLTVLKRGIRNEKAHICYC